MNTNEKITILARRRKKKGKSKASTGRSGMLKVVMKFLSGDTGDKLANAVNNGDPDAAKNIWNGIADDLYQAVEMIRDEKASKARKNADKSKDSNTEPNPQTNGTESA